MRTAPFMVAPISSQSQTKATGRALNWCTCTP